MARKQTILIIDDQPSTRLLLSHYLSNFYHVIEKSGARDALDYLSKGLSTDVIISDILMPEMSGIEFLNAYQQQQNHNSPVIVLSSVENSAERLKCFKHGARDFVTKPFNPEELYVRIKNVLTN